MSKNFEPVTYVHGSKLLRKFKNEHSNDIQNCISNYEIWKSNSLNVTGRSKDDVSKLVDYLNVYKDAVEPFFDKRANSAQEVLQPSILEEFFEYLFCNIQEIIGRELLRKPASGYIDLIFNPSSVQALVEQPEYTIRQKDHDFVLGVQVKLNISTNSNIVDSTNIVIPAVAIECKRYLERNMLDECAGTAEKVKRATPYCKYYVVSEFLKMDDASPEITAIDEIYIPRKQRNSDRLQPGFVPNPVCPDLVWDLYETCINHLKRIWWDPQSALTKGKVFDFD